MPNINKTMLWTVGLTLAAIAVINSTDKGRELLSGRSNGIFGLGFLGL